MGADSPEQIIFTSGGSEANNLALYWFENMYFRTEIHPFLVNSRIEHESLIRAADRLVENTHGCQHITLSPDDGGIITIAELEKMTRKCRERPSAVLVSVMSANNEIGTLNPVYGLCGYSHNQGWLFHTDAVQAAGLYPLNVSQNCYDFVSVSSHKIHGPKGVGALYAKSPELIHPLIFGGNHQEFGKRGGTENVAGIVGFGEACRLMSTGYEERRKFFEALGNTFLASIARNFTRHHLALDSFHINGEPPDDVKTINLRFDGIDAQTLLLMLDAQGVCVSAGSACTAHEDTPSHVLKAIGLTDEEARSSIRISFSHMNTIAEAEQAAQIIADCVKVLRS